MRSLKITLIFVSLLLALTFLSPANMLATKKTASQHKSHILAPATEAATGFDGLTNGAVDQDSYDEALATFEQVDEIPDGLGPIFNAKACSDCHTSPLSGGTSEITELRAGHFDGTNFIEPAGGSLIHSRALDPTLQEQIPPGNEVRALRQSLSLLGLGFIEAIDDNAILNVAAMQPKMSKGRINGQAIMVSLTEAPNVKRVGRFGWKDQHASLLSFSADAYVNEMGITTLLEPNEPTFFGNSALVTQFNQANGVDDLNDPTNDANNDFTTFTRATKAPPRDTTLAATSDAQQGAQIFNSIGCVICHVANYTTLPSGTVINGGTYTIPDAIGNKTVHPFSDFLLHDIGTGDGIVQNGGPETRNKLRTPLLWGLRTRVRLMHDGQSVSVDDAIRRHAGESRSVIAKFRKLDDKQNSQLFAFLRSL